MSQTSKTLSHYKAQHALVTWGGVILNFALAIPMLIAPGPALDLLGIPHPEMIWARMGALALIFVTIFYIPMTLDIDRFRIFAWLSIFPVRFCGAFFFTLYVVIGGAPSGFLLVGLIDAFIALCWLYCMIRIVTLEQDIATGRADT